ncbi:MAG: hypothetical protein WCV68_04585, partial [Candidatus Paceibacterota bacterium]
MCQAFSCLVTKSDKVYWKAGVDSHEDLRTIFSEPELKDDKDAPANTFARIEIVPPKGNYLDTKSKWIFKIDEKIKPSWLTDKHEVLARKELSKWKKQVYTFNLKEAKNPIHPFKIKPHKIGKKELELLENWASVGAWVGDSVWAWVWDSVRDSVRDSVWAWVGDSVGDSVWDSVGDSVGASVWDSVGAYIGSLFVIEEWKYVNYNNKLFKKGVYPFESCVKLWK